MNCLIFTLMILAPICHAADPAYWSGLLPQSVMNQKIDYQITDVNYVNETLLQCFRCKSGSELKKLNFYASYEDTSNCNDWKIGQSNAGFNATLGNETQWVQFKNVTTYTVHLNGNLILYQLGQILEGPCVGGFWEKFVINIVDQSGCSGSGVTKHIPVYALAKITGGRCDATCPGKVSVWFDPPIRNVAEKKQRTKN